MSGKLGLGNINSRKWELRVNRQQRERAVFIDGEDVRKTDFANGDEDSAIEDATNF